jgi:ATP adenylyltransferase
MKSPIWAPWRMEYILGVKPQGCVFCAMAELEPTRLAEQHVLAMLPDTLVCLNRYPFAAGHLLVIPRRHSVDLFELPAEEYVSFARVLQKAAVRLRRAVRAHGLNVGVNLGEAAGAGISDHAHAHIVPRWQGDSNFMPVLADIRVMPQHLDDTYEHLLPHFAEMGKEAAP